MNIIEKLRFLEERAKDRKEFIVSGKFHNYTYQFTPTGELIDTLFGGNAISDIRLTDILNNDLELKSKNNFSANDYLITTDGVVVKAIEPEKNTLVIHLANMYNKQDLERMKKQYEEDSGMRVVLLNGEVKDFAIVTKKDDFILIKEEHK